MRATGNYHSQTVLIRNGWMRTAAVSETCLYALSCIFSLDLSWVEIPDTDTRKVCCLVKLPTWQLFPQKKCSYVQNCKGGPEHPSQLWATTDEQLSSSRCAPPRGSTCLCSNSSGQSLSEGEWNLPSLQHRRILPAAFQGTAGLLHCGKKKVNKVHFPNP